MATSGKVGRVLIQSEDAAVAFADEATTADGTKKIYTITDVTKKYWDRATTPTVKVDGSTVTTGYTIEPGGVIVFAASQGSSVVTVSGKYVTLEQLAGFFNWSLSVSNKTIDATTFESGEWEEYVLSTKNFTVSAEKFWATGDNFTDRLGNEIFVELYTDFGTPKTRFVGYATYNTIATNVPANELISTKLDFNGVQGIYYRAG